jgi:hypothetical protein
VEEPSYDEPSYEVTPSDDGGLADSAGTEWADG